MSTFSLTNFKESLSFLLPANVTEENFENVDHVILLLFLSMLTPCFDVEPLFRDQSVKDIFLRREPFYKITF